MTLKEEFLACETYAEYDARREEFSKLGTDDKAEGPFYAPKGAHMDVNFAAWREANEDDV